MQTDMQKKKKKKKTQIQEANTDVCKQHKNGRQVNL